MIKTDGTLWGMGENYSGQAAGRSLAVTPSSPNQIGALTTWSQVKAGYSNTFALKTDGTLWSWGDGTSGNLWSGLASNRNSPVQVGTLTNWISIGTGSRTMAIRKA